MDFAFSQEEQALIGEIREFIEREMTQELLDETEELGGVYGGQQARKFIQKMGKKGWLTPNWPREFGGLGYTEMVTYMIRDELAYAGLPLYYVGAYNAGPVIMKYGSNEIKEKFLLPIARGEIEFALGYTEPQAGSDVSALEIRAEDKGDYFLLNGQKTFNTHAHVADYHWLACRTNAEGPKHKGITMMIVDLKTKGITIRPLITMAGWRTNEVFYDDVVVPKKNVVGEINRGFYYMMEALDYERMFAPKAYQKLFEDLVHYAKNNSVDGNPLSKDALVRQKLAQIATELEVARLLYYQLPYMLDKGTVPNYQSAMEKMFATEMAQRITRTGMDILGLHGQLKEGSKWAPLLGRVELYYRWSIVETIYAGTSEIMRNIIAQRGLGLPRG